MKKCVKKNRNKKGSVLLTVLCFTLVCMVLASTALSLASFSAKTSNTNVRSTQAEISAQNYLQEYLNTFTGTGDDKYKDLAALANSNAEFTANLKDNSGNNVNGVSTNAKIKVLKSGTSGIIVRSEVESNGETEVASAYFDGKATNPYISTNVIETTETANADKFGMKSDGDVNFECEDPKNTVYYTNNQSNNKGDIIVQANFVAGMNTTVTISDSVRPKSDGTGTEKKAAKVRVQGWLFWNQANMENETVATPHAGTAPVDGYVYGENGICFAGSSGGTHIGKNTGTTPPTIDVYSGGNVYFAKIPAYLPDASNATIANGDRAAIEPLLNGIGCSNKFLSDIGSCAEIYGDLNCAKNLVIANQTTATVHGTVNVIGNIYLLGNAQLNAANVNCSGKVIHCDSNGNFIEELNQWHSAATFVMPDSFTADSKLSEHYKGFSTNEIFEDQFEGHNSANELHLAEKYENAWNSTKAAGVDWKDHVFIDKNCTITLNDAFNDFKAHNSWYTQDFKDFAQTQLKGYIDSKVSDPAMRYRLWINLGGVTTAPKTDGFNFNIDEITQNDSFKKNFKFVLIMPSSEDQVVILPAGGTGMQDNPMKDATIYVDYSHSAKYTKTGNEANADYIYDNTYAASHNKQTAVNFCYFMVDTGSASGDWYRLGSGWTQENPIPKVEMPTDKVFNLSEMTIADITRYPDIETAGKELANTAVPYSEKMCGNNNFIMVPNKGSCFVRSQDGKKCIQAILYGPKSNITIDGPANSRVFLGQAITGTFNNNQCDSECATLLPSPGSIMDTIVANKNNTSVIKLQYFVKSKT